MNTKTLTLVSSFSLFLLSLLGCNYLFVPRVAALRDIVFPVIGESTYSNDFYAPRGDRQHNAIDIIAKKGQKLVAAVKGTIVDVQYPKPGWGYSVTIEDDDGWRYTYIHMNDDRPGTNDGKGGGMNAYAADMKEGNRVARGQLLGYVGDSGYSNGIPHLHFEISFPSGKVSNPYQSLRHATRISKPRIPGVITEELLPYGTTFSKTANITMGNFDLDPASEFVVSPGQGGGPHVKVYDDNGTQMSGFFAYHSGFRGGVDVATGDINGDGTDEILTAPATQSSHVRVFSSNGTQMSGFFAFPSDIKNGLRITAGDINGDLKDEIIVGLNAGGQPRVKILNLASGSPVTLRDFLAFSSGFRGGVDVASGNVDLLQAFDEVIVSTGLSGDPKVRVYNSSGTRLKEFFAYSEVMEGGVRVSVGNVLTGNLQEEIATLPASKGNPQAKLFDSNGAVLSSRMFMEEWWVGNYDIAAGFDTSKVVTGGNRRVSLRLAVD